MCEHVKQLHVKYLFLYFWSIDLFLKMYAFLTRRLKEKNHQKIFAETKRRKEKTTCFIKVPVCLQFWENAVF
jgi:late competence protein required for DNA uptake (superfamily II DNA/RNA helicase)